MPLIPDEKSSSVATAARKISNDLGHIHVGVEHLVLAMIEVDDIIVNFFSNLGIERKTLCDSIKELAGPGDKDAYRSEVIETIRYKRVIKNTEKIAISVKSFKIEPAHTLLAIIQEKRGVPVMAIRELGFDPEMVERELQSGFSGGVFTKGKPGSGNRKDAQDGNVKNDKDKGKKETKLLAQYSKDLIEYARSGKMDPVVGRNDEIRRVLQTLTRKGKNNPVLIGEAGVGKTAVVYGLAQRIAEGNVPDMLKNKRVLDLSLAAIVAGAKHRGEFEERLQAIIKEVAENPDVVLFIDEIHTIVGAGDAKGGMDAGNILKPMLARGEFPCIGATTIDEFRKSIEQDPALERRFQPVLVHEPSEEDTLEILKGLKERYEKHHGVKFTEKCLISAVKMSVRYLPDRNLPDKAIDLIDEAAAKVKMKSVSISDGGSLTIEVTDEVIAEVLSLWTGIPVTKLTSEEKERLLQMEKQLASRVISQDEAIRIVSQTIRVVRMGLGNPNRPSGIFLFLGPTGVGKTELAKALADFLFGSEKEMIRLDMSEYMEKHTVARLIGSPPGYVGHEEEGQLTKQVRTKPYSVVLLDEIEKAHPDVFDLFLQVFDEGRLSDSKGRAINFTNTIIILTSNIGTSKVDEQGNTMLVDTSNKENREEIMKALRKAFRPEFLNRIDEIIIFNNLREDSIKQIISLILADMMKRLIEKNITLQLDDDAVDFILKKGFDPSYGARPLKRAVQTYLTKPLAEKILSLGEDFTGKIFVKACEEEDKLVLFELPREMEAGNDRQKGVETSQPGNPSDTLMGGSDENKY